MNEQVILYTIGCPQCVVLEKKLKNAGIQYEVVSDKDIMTKIGITVAPVLQVGEGRLGFSQAIQWVNNQ